MTALDLNEADLLRPGDLAVQAGPVKARRGRWVFLGESSLPQDPTARQHEKRGRKWLVLSYFLCPCHLPLALTIVGAALGGTAFGAAVTGNALRAGIVLTAAYGVVLWRGFRQIVRAKRIEAGGGRLSCTGEGCRIASPRPTF